ncbi:MAG: iron-sulfur cluster assembly scaffold protein [Synergistaceae bacterium]|jgi:nitrogen fixation NifU-like protein|nr:iron-sulfur cluster assembly scaffold protein [Synergistaceae bacterium]
MYNEKVVDYFMNPRNSGKMTDANAIGEAGNAVCGDTIKIYLKVSDEHIIEDIRFETFGCAAAIATSSMITEMVKGKSLSEALKIKDMDVVKELNGLPPAKEHCSLLAQEGIKEAVLDYFRRRGEQIPKGLFS